MDQSSAEKDIISIMTLDKKSITCIDTILHWFADQIQLKDTEYIKFETAKYYLSLLEGKSTL